jgi:hypothetical protein
MCIAAPYPLGKKAGKCEEEEWRGNVPLGKAACSGFVGPLQGKKDAATDGLAASFA